MKRAPLLGVFLGLLGCTKSSADTLFGGGVDAGPAQVAPKDSSAVKAPPPLRVTKVTVPALPDLPSLQNHAAAQPVPIEVRLGTVAGNCKGVWNGSEVVARSCAKSALYGSNKEGAKPLISHATLRGGPKVPPILPAIVDHRAEGTEGVVRNQSTVPACTAFAEAAAIDHAIARWTLKPPNVSVMEIWSRYHTAIEQNAINSNVSQPMCAEADWPFAIPEATSWLPCDQVANPKKYGCGQPVDQAKQAKAASKVVGKLTRVVFLQQPDTNALKTIIAAGQDVIVTMTIPDSFMTKGNAGSRYIPHYETVQNQDVGHAMLLAGYVNFAHGTYFLIHNSWGTGWGDGGYAWIHEATIAKWTREYLVLDAEPDVKDANQRPVRARGETTCPMEAKAELVPDSITGACAPRCPDGSPRHDGVCAAAKNPCANGYVNLNGTCVIAAPSTTGTDDKTGIAWKCGPGGCSYDLPRGVDPSCTGNTCKASCPAPDYRVATQGTQLTCVE